MLCPSFILPSIPHHHHHHHLLPTSHPPTPPSQTIHGPKIHNRISPAHANSNISIIKIFPKVAGCSLTYYTISQKEQCAIYGGKVGKLILLTGAGWCSRPDSFPSPPSSLLPPPPPPPPPPTTTFHKSNQSIPSHPARPTPYLHSTPTPPPIPACPPKKNSILEPRRRGKKGKALYLWANDAIVGARVIELNSGTVVVVLRPRPTPFPHLLSLTHTHSLSLSLSLSLPLIPPTSSANPKPSSTHTPG